MKATLAINQCQMPHLLAARLGQHRASAVTRRIPLPAGTTRVAVEHAWTALLRRHAGLRVRFHDEGGRLTQEIRAYDQLPNESRRVATAPPAAEALDPFGAVLIGASVAMDGDRPVSLRVSVSHALVDAVAMDLVAAFIQAYLRDPASVGAEADDGAAFAAVSYRLTEAAARADAGATAFWAGQPTPSDWPFPFTATQTAPDGGASHTWIDLDDELTTRLSSGARSMNASVAIAAQAALLAVLRRRGDGDRRVVGVPMSLRDRHDIGFDAVGLYLNVLPSIVEFDGSTTFRQLVRRVRDNLLDLQDIKDGALTHTAASANLSSPGRRRSYFDLMFVARAEPEIGRLRERLATGEDVPLPSVPLNVELATGDGGGVLVITWQPTTVRRSDADDLAASYLRCLRRMLDDPDAPVGGPDAVPADPPPAADDRTVAQQVEAVIRTAPHAVAVCADRTEWTFRDLGQAVRVIRDELRGAGIPAGARVGVGFGRSPWQIASALAIWSDGFRYVPLDTGGPADRTAFIAADAEIRALLCGDALADGRVPSTVTVLAGHRRPGDATDWSPDDAAPAAADEVAYVMYTSGTSGRPKGVEITHGNLVSFMAAMTSALPAATRGPWLAETAPTFDISVLEMFWPLLHGQAVVIGQPGQRVRGADMATFAHRQSTPSRARQLLTARALDEPLGAWDVPPDHWLIGGERLPATLLAELRAVYPDTTFVNMYGPTEATIWATYHVVSGAEGAQVPLGRPLPNTGCHIVGDDGRPVPVGVRGEIVLSGPAISPGYVNQPQETARRFAPPAGSGARGYRTGDLGSFDPDGLLHFHGRNDDQVKIRGHRIEPGEVEHHLQRLPDVDDAVVVVLANGDGTVDLAAAVLAQSGTAPSAADLRQALRARVPDALVPAHLSVVAQLPRLTSGKIDRVAVREFCDAARSGTPPVADPGPNPAGAVADVLRAAGGLLNRSVAATDNFFDIGGNSLTALELVAELRAGGLDVEVEDIYVAADLAELAAVARPVG